MTEVTPHPLKTQGFHHFLFYCFTTTRLMASVVLSIMGYQDGIQMDEAYVMQDESIDIDAKSKNIQPGTTQDVKYAFVLSNTTSDVTVEAEEWLGSGAKAEKIFTFTDGSLQ